MRTHRKAPAAVVVEHWHEIEALARELLDRADAP
jgi:hypothetical protein